LVYVSQDADPAPYCFAATHGCVDGWLWFEESFGPVLEAMKVRFVAEGFGCAD
jgi:hypothetical protein